MLFEERAGVGEAEDEDVEDDGDGVEQNVLKDHDDGLGGADDIQKTVPDEKG